MNNILQNITLILIVFFSFESAYSQSLSYNDLTDGEIYYLDMTMKEPQYDVIFFGPRSGEEILRGYKDKKIKGIFKFNEINRTEERRIPWKYIYKSPLIDIDEMWFTNGWGSARENIEYTIYIRNATQEEKDWLNACIKANKFIPKEETLKNKKQENVLVDSQSISKKNTDSKPPEKTAQKYDVFGNPINTKSTNQTQLKTDPNQKTKYDVFGNPIKENAQSTTSQTGNSKPATQQKTTNKTQEKVYFLAYAFNRNVGGCNIKINDHVGYIIYEGQHGDYLKAVEAVKAKYPDAEDFSASDFRSGQHFVLVEVYLLERTFSKSEGSCKRTVYEMSFDTSLEDTMAKIKKRYGTSILQTKVLINKTY